MPLRLELDHSAIDAQSRFLAQAAGQLPFAASLALNNTARDVQQSYRRQTTQSFVAPVAFTRSAFRYDKATKISLEARVYPLPDRPYLATQSFGGARRWKGYEGLIRGLSGSALPDRQLIPTRIAINAAGNPRRSLFGQIQSGLSTTDPRGFFIGPPRGDGRAPGVYRRSRGKLHPLFLSATSQPRYQPRFPFEAVGMTTVGRVYQSHLSAAIDRAIASAR